MKYTKMEYAHGILALEVQYRAPALDYVEGGSTLGIEKKTEATTSRDRLISAINVDHQQGQAPLDVYITASDLREVMEVSHDTAYRWLERFKDSGILTVAISGDTTGYRLNSKYASMLNPSTHEYKTPEEVVDTAREFRKAVESA